MFRIRIACGKHSINDKYFYLHPLIHFSIISRVVSKMHVSRAENMEERNLNGKKREIADEKFLGTLRFSCYSVY